MNCIHDLLLFLGDTMLQKSEIQNINSDTNPMYKRILSFYSHFKFKFEIEFLRNLEMPCNYYF